MKKILTIDGGGIKGLFAATFLAELEEKCDIKIVDYFDLIAGTSTGAIIASALSLGMPAKKIQDLYIEKARMIFPTNSSFLPTKTKYKKEPLQAELETVFGDLKVRDCMTRLVIPAFNLSNGSTRVFKTPHAEDLYFDKNINLVDCILASTAAPLYFPPHQIGDDIYIDGGVGANNPSLIALTEAISTRCGWKLNDIVMLSIGGVNAPGATKGTDKMGLLDALKIQKSFMSAESQYADFICNILLSEGNYFRINQNDDRNQVSIDCVKEEAIQCLKSWGYNQAMQKVHTIKTNFFTEKKEDVKFFNL